MRLLGGFGEEAQRWKKKDFRLRFPNSHGEGGVGRVLLDFLSSRGGRLFAERSVGAAAGR